MKNISKQLRVSVLVALGICLLVILFPPCKDIAASRYFTGDGFQYVAENTRVFLFSLKTHQTILTERLLLEFTIGLIIGAITYFVYPLIKKEE